MDYLAEANIDGALQIASGSMNARHAIRRLADRMFEPFMQRIWVPAGSETAVDHPGLIAWLDRPYAQQGRCEPERHTDRPVA